MTETACARDLRPGMVIQATGTIEDIRYLDGLCADENGLNAAAPIRITFSDHAEVTVHPGTQFTVDTKGIPLVHSRRSRRTKPNPFFLNH